MNYQTIYDGIKILEMHKKNIIEIFSIYLKAHLNKEDISNKDKLLYDKFKNFYKSIMIKTNNPDDKDILKKNTITLLNILTLIATKHSLTEDNLNIVYKLLGNFQQIQSQFTSNLNNFQTIINTNQNIKSDNSTMCHNSESDNKKNNKNKDKLILEKEQYNIIKYEKEKQNMMSNLNKLMTFSPNKKENEKNSCTSSESSTEKETEFSESPKKIREHKINKSSIFEQSCKDSKNNTDTSNFSSSTSNNTFVNSKDSSVCTNQKPQKSMEFNYRNKKYSLLSKPLSLLAKDYYQARSIMYIYDESANKYIDKYSMFDCNKLIDECDVYNYNLIVRSMYERMHSTLYVLDKNLNGIEKLLCKLHIKNSKINNLKTITVSEKVFNNTKYVEFTYGSKIFDIYYIDESMSYDQMVNRISSDLSPVLEFIRLISLNIILVCQELELNSATSKNIQTDIYDIYKVIVNDLENCC